MSGTTAFLEINAGGVASKAEVEQRRRYDADGRPFPRTTVKIDTDPETFRENESRADVEIPIGLDEEKLAVLIGSPQRFGRNVGYIVEHMAKDLDPDELENGSRTKRAITQLAAAYHRDSLRAGIRNAIDHLRRQKDVRKIVPLIKSSSGGGCGSALQVWLAHAFATPRFRHDVMLGVPQGMLKPAILAVVEPYAYVKVNPGEQARKILANAYAYRKETDWLLARRAARLVFHVGYANRYGAVLADPLLMARVLGASVYELERNWGKINGRLVDREFSSGYPGGDTPEVMLLRRGHNFEER